MKKRHYFILIIIGLLLLGIWYYYKTYSPQNKGGSQIVSGAIQGGEILLSQMNENTKLCQEQTSQEYLSNKECLEKIVGQNLTGVDIYNAIDECFSYRENIDYSQKNKCYNTNKRNDVLYSICVESIRKNNFFDSLGEPLVMLEFRIQMASCMATMVFRTESFSVLSKELGEGSSFKKCSKITQCGEQELCNVNQSGHCEKFESYLYSAQEIEPIIKDNDFTSQGCAHSGVCSITSTDGKGYAYKQNIPVESLLIKYGKTIKQRWIE